MKKDKLTPTPMEIIEMLMQFSLETKEHFEKIDNRFDKIEKILYYHETWLRKIEDTMATKVQLKSLVGILERNGAISSFDSSHILHNHPEREL
jgi:hypothetical protein